jgi:hypothetical protein
MSIRGKAAKWEPSSKAPADGCAASPWLDVATDYIWTILEAHISAAIIRQQHPELLEAFLDSQFEKLCQMVYAKKLNLPREAIDHRDSITIDSFRTYAKKRIDERLRVALRRAWAGYQIWLAYVGHLEGSEPPVTLDKANGADVAHEAEISPTRGGDAPPVSTATRAGAARSIRSVNSPAAAAKVAEYIENRPMTRTQFATNAGTTPRTLRNFLKTGKVLISTFDGIARAAGMATEDLLRGGR